MEYLDKDSTMDFARPLLTTSLLVGSGVVGWSAGAGAGEESLEKGIGVAARDVRCGMEFPGVLYPGVLFLEIAPGKVELHRLLIDPSRFSLALWAKVPIPLLIVAAFQSGSIRPWLGLMAGCLVSSIEPFLTDPGSKRIESVVGNKLCLEGFDNPEPFMDGEDL